jgi:hypothetical protein
VVDTADELLAGILDAACHTKKREDQLTRTASFFRRNQWLHLQQFISETWCTVLSISVTVELVLVNAADVTYVCSVQYDSLA